jgi:hypothetical protein
MLMLRILRRNTGRWKTAVNVSGRTGRCLVCKMLGLAADTQQIIMKTNNLISSKLLALAMGGVLATPAAMAATTYTKGGMQSTTGYATSGAHGSNLPMLAPGVQELGVSGFLNWEDTTTYALHLSYGRFVTNNWMVGGKVGIDGQNSDAGGAIGVFVEYNHLTGSQWVPFIGVSFEYNRLNYDDSNLNSFRAGAELGVKYFMRSNMALSLAVGGGWNSNTAPGSDDFQKQVNLGLRYYF